MLTHVWTNALDHVNKKDACFILSNDYRFVHSNEHLMSFLLLHAHTQLFSPGYMAIQPLKHIINPNNSLLCETLCFLFPLTDLKLLRGRRKINYSSSHLDACRLKESHLIVSAASGGGGAQPTLLRFGTSNKLSLDSFGLKNMQIKTMSREQQYPVCIADTN